MIYLQINIFFFVKSNSVHGKDHDQHAEGDGHEEFDDVSGSILELLFVIPVLCGTFSRDLLSWRF